MLAFLNQVAQYIHQNYDKKIDQLCIVLPNKRGALFLKNYLAKTYNQTIWLPSIISAEDLIRELSGLQNLEEVELICSLYETYIEVYNENPESFESFAKWGNLILQDFNEIDRYLADGVSLYSNLRDIKEIENWSLSQEELTDFQKNYIKFMGKLGSIYSQFTSKLLEQGKAYQGLAYRQAAKNLEKTDFTNRYHKFIFCGFNALNSAETFIFSKLCEAGKAEILWDADTYYLDSTVQEAGLFLRRNQKVFGEKNFNFIHSHFKEEKQIDIIAVPKQIGQAQTVSKVIDDLIKQGESPDTIAVVLANEKMLWPVLKLLPNSIEHVNITMEYPVKYTSPFSFIDNLLKLQIAFENQNRSNPTIYYKDFLSLLRHNFFAELSLIKSLKNTNEIIHRILDKNYAFISDKLLKELFAEDYNSIKLLFTPWKSAKEAAQVISNLLSEVKTHYLNSEINSYKSLELEYLEVLIRNFNRVNDFINKYSYFDSLKSFRILFSQIVGTSSAAFLGEPLKGLQIMGVLETRTLDFKNVIFVSVNEGVLPSGKSINSFIPNDLKRYFNLPLYGDKDAIYAYHFYRLLQRAEKCFITYDTETDTFGKGEKSRFVSQLQFELNNYNPAIKINEYVAQSNLDFNKEEYQVRIPKNTAALDRILNKALSNEEYKGLSPSSLITYKDCALKFYFRYGVGLVEPVELEESAEANTFGSILHEALEKLYTPYINNKITTSLIKSVKPGVSGAVESAFLNYFSESEAFMGKNLLQQNVLKVYVEKLLDFDIDQINNSETDSFTILALEKEMEAHVKIVVNGKETNAFIKGKADRIDDFEGNFRIIDYKSSVKDSDKFEFIDCATLFSNKKFDKMLQLFIYAWMAWKNNLSAPESIRPCIIPFKVFEKEPRYITFKKQPLVFTSELLSDFENHLSDYIQGILAEGGEFVATDDEDICEYCAYRSICNR